MDHAYLDEKFGELGVCAGEVKLLLEKYLKIVIDITYRRLKIK